jgi:hypothetical protein
LPQRILRAVVVVGEEDPVVGIAALHHMKALIQGVYDLLGVWSGELSRESRWVLGGQAVGS